MARLVRALALASAVLLHAAHAAAAAPAAVTVYPPAFFAAAQPNTAFDMVLLLPGFSLDRGDAVRGFGGAAGNVLIDGARPASKTDSLDEVLKRIPAKSVAAHRGDPRRRARRSTCRARR